MCGIWGLFGFHSTDTKQYDSAFKIAHRGPDCFLLQNISSLRNCVVAFHRLEVVDSVRGMQPMRLQQYPHLTLLCNGEIYNFKKLRQEFQFKFESECDCEVILHLYNKFGLEKTCTLLDGVFALIIVDTVKQQVMFARDTYGVRPMFYFSTSTGQVGVSSEAKGLFKILSIENGERKQLKVFPPANCATYDFNDGGRLTFKEMVKFHSFSDMPGHWKYHDIELIKGDDYGNVKNNIRNLFISAVEKRLMASRRVGSLLSGGLDSSLVAAIAAKKMKIDNSKVLLPTFSIGMGEDSPDLIAARKVADHIGSEHHEVPITTEEALQAVDEVIYAIESYDVTTVRASTPMYILSKYVSSQTDTIVIMSGEGADELAQGYIYFHKQPSPEEGDKESRRLLEDLHLYDVLRSDRSTAAFGLEVRAPFLDHAFTSYFLSVPAEMRAPKEGVEKHLVRSSFDGTGLLPDEILWRRKEAFSDGVSSRKKSWFEILQDHISDKVSDEELSQAAVTFAHNTPRTKEAYYYRTVFERHYGSHMSALIPYQWMPRWMGECNDPSARVLSHYKNDEEQPIKMAQ